MKEPSKPKRGRGRPKGSGSLPHRFEVRIDDATKAGIDAHIVEHGNGETSDKARAALRKAFPAPKK